MNININIITKNGKRSISAKVGSSLLDALHSLDENDKFNSYIYDAVPGNCGGVCACSTCHVSIDDETFKKLDFQSQITEDEADMLDLAVDPTLTSRLACQITLSREMDNMSVYI